MFDFRSYIILPKTAAPDSPRTAIIRPGTFSAEKLSMGDFYSVTAVIQTVYSLLIYLLFSYFM